MLSVSLFADIIAEVGPRRLAVTHQRYLAMLQNNTSKKIAKDVLKNNPSKKNAKKDLFPPRDKGSKKVYNKVVDTAFIKGTSVTILRFHSCSP